MLPSGQTQLPPLRFKAVRPKKASTLIAEQILRLVESGELGIGHRLPAERVLAQQFDVNRQSVREALSALQLLGVVETRAGSGTVVALKTSRSGDLLSEIRRLDEQDNPFEVMEARMIIEPEIVRLAVKRATPIDLRSFQKAIDDHEAEVRAGKMPPVGDLKVHGALAHASGNPVLVRFMNSVVSSTGQWLWRLRSQQEWERKRSLLYLEHHRHILKAIKAGDARGAVQAMRIHLQATRDMLMGHPESRALQGSASSHKDLKPSR